MSNLSGLDLKKSSFRNFKILGLLDWTVYHRPLEGMSSPDAEDMSADTDTDDNEEEAPEEEGEVKLGSLDPMFKLAMEICPSYHRREFEFDLWNNRPATSDEAIDRAIVMRTREPPSTSSQL